MTNDLTPQGGAPPPVSRLRLLYLLVIPLYLVPLTGGYIVLLTTAQDACYRPVCERACAAASRKYEGLRRSGRGPSVTGCACSGSFREPDVKPRFYSDSGVLDGLIRLLVTCVELAALLLVLGGPLALWGRWQVTPGAGRGGPPGAPSP
jgi:hypothetical protein